MSSYVILGAHNIRQSEPSQVQISAESFYIHEAYDNRTAINDIAVVKLSEPAPLNGNLVTYLYQQIIINNNLFYR